MKKEKNSGSMGKNNRNILIVFMYFWNYGYVIVVHICFFMICQFQKLVNNQLIWFVIILDFKHKKLKNC